MDKYRRVEKPYHTEPATKVDHNEIRITQQGKVRSYISYGHGLFVVSFVFLFYRFNGCVFKTLLLILAGKKRALRGIESHGQCNQ